MDLVKGVDAMKPVVRQVDGEWRVWVETPLYPGRGRAGLCPEAVFLGDVVELANGEPLEIDMGTACQIAEGTTAAPVIEKVVDSPGLPCEVEGALGVDLVRAAVIEAIGKISVDAARIAGEVCDEMEGR